MVVQGDERGRTGAKTGSSKPEAALEPSQEAAWDGVPEEPQKLRNSEPQLGGMGGNEAQKRIVGSGPGATRAGRRLVQAGGNRSDPREDQG